MQAILLCGGKGERLRPLTEQIPKPLIPIKGRPIVDYIVDHLKKFNISEIIVAAGYKAEKIVAHFVQNPSVIVRDSGDVDIIRRIKDCKKLIKGDFLLFYGDTLSDVDLKRLIAFHIAHNELATVTAWPMRSQFGIMELDDSEKVIEFKEKPILDKWINIGHFYFSAEALNLMEEFESFESFLKYLVQIRQLNAYKHQGIHITVNTVRELADAEENLEQMNLFNGDLWQEVSGLEKEYLSPGSTVLLEGTSLKP